MMLNPYTVQGWNNSQSLAGFLEILWHSMIWKSRQKPALDCTISTSALSTACAKFAAFNGCIHGFHARWTRLGFFNHELINRLICFVWSSLIAVKYRSDSQIWFSADFRFFPNSCGSHTVCSNLPVCPFTPSFLLHSCIGWSVRVRIILNMFIRTRAISLSLVHLFSYDFALLFTTTLTHTHFLAAFSHSSLLFWPPLVFTLFFTCILQLVFILWSICSRWLAPHQTHNVSTFDWLW